jgi:hypothetical protein
VTNIGKTRTRRRARESTRVLFARVLVRKMLAYTASQPMTKIQVNVGLPKYKSKSPIPVKRAEDIGRRETNVVARIRVTPPSATKLVPPGKKAYNTVAGSSA